ncbi:MAG: glycosyltransferase [Nocardioides sp.]|uniref:glycosyltransferase family 2 protein n=1 Tax=Nocardioides sp. TaxID=35761 RepID=UPI0039E2B1A6
MSESTVSVVIPSVGRPALRAAIQSALGQTVPPLEVLVCLDTADDISDVLGDLADDPRVRLLRVGPGHGGNAARQAGIQNAAGRLIALLDDDDLWESRKLELQLSAIAGLAGDDWLATSRLVARTPTGDQVWPARLIAARESVPDYIFHKRKVRGGIGFVQASTLLFPAALGRRVPWNSEIKFHQDIDWLVSLDEVLPNLTVVQLPEALTIYHVGQPTVSRTLDPELSWAWALRRLSGSPRSLGDFGMTSVTTYAARRANPLGVLRYAARARRVGAPSLAATAFAGYQFAMAVRLWTTLRLRRLIANRRRGKH